MTTNSTTAEGRLAELGIQLPEAPTPFGAYVPAVQTGKLLFLSGMLATSGHAAAIVGVVGKDLDVNAGREAAHIAALNALALARKQLGSLNRVTHVVRLGVGVASRRPRREDRIFVPCHGRSSLPFGSPVELEVILEV
jgi:enamine deaminase RidA (YjgF/YER057c/UK114 family)